jgi:hypothetical protein
MPRKMTPQQTATWQALKDQDKVSHVRSAWDGKTLLLGVGFATGTTLMYRITPDGVAKGV